MSNRSFLSALPPIVSRRSKRIGRGHGSGKVKTSGRGTKGQKARGKMPLGFEGGQLPLIKRLPLLRGKGKNKSQKYKVAIVKISSLSVLKKNDEVTIDILRKYALVTNRVKAAKLLAGGVPDRAYKVRIFCSESARKIIEKAGGSVVSQE